MKLSTTAFQAALVAAGTFASWPLTVAAQSKCSVPGTMTCFPVTSTTGRAIVTPTLDADLSDWAEVQGGITTGIRSIFGKDYMDGDEQATYKCLYDEQKIYFALEIPGIYKFDELDNKKCAAIGTMMKIGSKAAYLNMGSCPDALQGCDAGPPLPECADYLVDLGAHWELRTTQQGVEYPLNATTGSGNDLIANNDDEYGVSAFCRPDDDGLNAANDWTGAWAHSNPIEDEMGVYTFEIARTLTTASNVTDKQLAAGETYDFGIAYWDPTETEFGWTVAGHFL